MHHASSHTMNTNAVRDRLRNEGQAHRYSTFNSTLFGLKENFKEIYDFAELNNNMANSKMVFGQLSSLQQQVAFLRQELASQERSFTDLRLYNWLLPRRSIQGVSGYLCEKCRTLSAKPIFDVGYDMTASSRHRCNEPDYTRNYLLYQVPTDVPNVNDWAGQLLVSFVNDYTFIGRDLMVIDITNGFRNLEQRTNSEIAYTTAGIPDRFSFHTLKYDEKPDWINHAIRNVGSRITMSDTEILDFVTRVKSTYGLFEISIGPTVRLISLILTH